VSEAKELTFKSHRKATDGTGSTPVKQISLAPWKKSSTSLSASFLPRSLIGF